MLMHHSKTSGRIMVSTGVAQRASFAYALKAGYTESYTPMKQHPFTLDITHLIV